MATEFCQKCKQAHPGRECDYDENSDCAETSKSTRLQNQKTKNQKPSSAVWSVRPPPVQPALFVET
jgi:hypothetical protein